MRFALEYGENIEDDRQIPFWSRDDLKVSPSGLSIRCSNLGCTRGAQKNAPRFINYLSVLSIKQVDKVRISYIGKTCHYCLLRMRACYHEVRTRKVKKALEHT